MPDNGESPSNAHLYQWSARMSAIAFEMVIPALIGIWLDRLLGTVVLCVILGVFLGMVLGFWHLLQFARENHHSGVDKSSDTGDNGRINEV